MAMPMAVRPFEMVPLGKPIELVRIQSPPIASLEFTIYRTLRRTPFAAPA